MEKPGEGGEGARENGGVIGPGDELMGRYEVESLIASGGMADVHLARDRRLGRAVALKSFRVGTDPRRFEAETRLLAALQHPNLMSVFDAGEHEGVPFIVLQHVGGPTLADRLRAGPLAPDDVHRLAVDVTSALHYVHGQRIVHRDVKPSNILFEPDGRAVLGDFGVAVLLDATRLTADAATIGTAAYLAPEQATGGDVDAATDIYALGLVLIEAQTGEPVFAGSLPEVVAAKLGGDPPVPAGLPSPWAGLLTAMTRRDPRARPDAGAVLAGLGAGGAAAAAGATQMLPAGVVPAEGGAEPTMVVPAGGAPGDPAYGVPVWRRPMVAVAMVVGAAAVLAGILFLGAGGADDGDERGATAATTTAAPVAAQTTTTTSRDARCAELEAQKDAIEDAIDDAKEDSSGGRGKDGDDDDDDEVEDLVKDLEDDKKAVEQEQKSSGC